MYADRIRRPEPLDRLMSADEATALFQDKMIVASSGFLKTL